jgi:hypothetical protein
VDRSRSWVRKMPGRKGIKTWFSVTIETSTKHNDPQQKRNASLMLSGCSNITMAVGKAMSDGKTVYYRTTGHNASGVVAK